MTTPYDKYLKIKNKYCIYYYGIFDEFVYQLLYLSPLITKKYPDIELYISCKDELRESLSDYAGVVFRSEFNAKDYGYVRELKFDYVDHPIESLFKESNINFDYQVKKQAHTPVNNRCAFFPNAIAPFKSLTTEQIQKAKQFIRSRGFEITEDAQQAGWAVGVENSNFYHAALRGIPVSLIESGIGTKLFQCAYPSGEILPI